MKYFFDTEFIEGTQKSFFSKTKQTIDLISIGIKAEDGREYYAISKDFNLKEAWNRFDLDYGSGDQRNHPPRKVYWIRENVLIPIFFELAFNDFHNVHFKDEWLMDGEEVNLDLFKSNSLWASNFKWFKKLINKYGKTNAQIAKEIIRFANHKLFSCNNAESDLEFYAYYADYDWVVFCWLFGRMIDLPNGFPMYCKDLKQLLDEACFPLTKDVGDYIHSCLDVKERCSINDIKYIFKYEGNIEDHPDYPKQTNEHNALADAIWNFELYKFLQKI